jgi:hypothetical protein
VRIVWPLILLIGAVTSAGFRVPSRRGNAVLVNGFIGSGEWDDAGKSALTDGHALLAKQDRHFVYFAIVAPAGTRHSGAELYVTDESGRIFSYHISSALGRREWRDGAWTDYEWQPASWTANVVPTIFEDGKMKALGFEAFEYQIARRNFQGRRLRVRVELRRPAAVFPSNTGETDPAGWLAVEL